MQDKEYSVEKRKIKNQYRYVVIDLDGNVLDDAQGYGYKSIQNVHRAMFYKLHQKEIKKSLENARHVITKDVIDIHDYCCDEAFLALKCNEKFNFKEEFWKMIEKNLPEFFDKVKDDKALMKSIIKTLDDGFKLKDRR